MSPIHLTMKEHSSVPLRVVQRCQGDGQWHTYAGRLGSQASPGEWGREAIYRCFNQEAGRKVYQLEIRVEGWAAVTS